MPKVILIQKRNDIMQDQDAFWVGFVSGLGSMQVIWPEMTLIQVVNNPHIPQVVIDFPIRMVFTIIVAFLSGFGSIAGKRVYQKYFIDKKDPDDRVHEKTDETGHP